MAVILRPPVSAASVHVVSAAIRVAIADEFPVFRDGLRRLLEMDARLRIVGVTGVLDAPILVRAAEPDVLLLGSRSPDRVVETLREVAEARPETRTILLTQSTAADAVARALEIGAWGVVAKDSAADRLFSSIETVAAGECWVGDQPVDGPEDIGPSIRRFDHARRQSQSFGLTRRELDIVRAVVNGDTNREIAGRLAISQNTVKRHLMHIFNKVGASTRVELALFAAHHRLLDVS
jgi:two-component system NarL family response regulator